MGNPLFDEPLRKTSGMRERPSVIKVMDMEIERDCYPPTGSVCTADAAQLQLYSYGELPHFLQGNPFVETGYRAFLSSSLCLRSMFVWTNETVNIWSHLLGFMLFFFLTFHDNVMMASQEGVHFSDHVMITSGLVCYQFCMLCSTGFHLFHCHSDAACRRWLSLDLAGISIGLIGCYLPAVHLAFYCNYLWRDVYLFVVSALAVVTLACQLHPRFLSPAWKHGRTALYSCLAAYGVVPTVHWVSLSGGSSSEVVQLFVPKVTAMYILGAAAFAFYILKCPERCLPGRFDYVGSSHQCWHVLVVIAFYYWRTAGRDILEYRLKVPCRF